MSEKHIAEDLVARPVPIGGLAEYHDHSIVSREVINKPGGTATIFAFDAGEGLSEHTAPYDAMVIVLEGRADIMISGVPHAVNAGEMIVMPANQPHALKAVDRFKMLLVLIK